MTPTALILPVLSADVLLRPWRSQWDAPAGVPAHVTLLHPFVPSIERPAVEELAEVLSATQPFSFELTRVERVAEVVWLAAEPAAPFAALIGELAARWPECAPAHDPVVPHVTVVQSPDAELRERVAAGLPQRLPLRARAAEVWLMGGSGDGWSLRSRFALGALRY